ncbi:UNVERIFIED_CONTAM: hypothetical protein FKN15_068122 [Acipenser sinensis]
MVLSDSLCLRASVPQCFGTLGVQVLPVIGGFVLRCFSILGILRTIRLGASMSQGFLSLVPLLDASVIRPRKRARNADQARDIAELKAPPAAAPEHTLALPVVVAEVQQQDVVMSEEEQDALSLVASWDEESFLDAET